MNIVQTFEVEQRRQFEDKQNYKIKDKCYCWLA